MAPSAPILNYKKVIELKTGGVVVVYLEILEISPNKAGLFLERYKLSWIAFLPEAPGRRVLMDAHHPFGIHYHLDDGRQISIQHETLSGALKFFEKKVSEHFGEMEESFYEDIHI